MPEFDETDLRILELLLTDGRRPFSQIADHVDLSAPAVADRIDQLRTAGVLRRVTIDIDRSKLAGGTHVLAELSVPPASVQETADALAEFNDVERVFATAGDRIFLETHVENGAIRPVLSEAGVLEKLTSIDVHAIDRAEWTPALDATAFAVDCAECGNTVTEEGELTTIDDTRHYFCCQSCQERFVDRYESMEEAAD